LEAVAHLRWTAVIPRVLIEDVRAGGRFLRVTVHEDSGVIVVSHWEGDECVAATRIPVGAAPELIELVQEAVERGRSSPA
jgi:hypothetical protein